MLLASFYTTALFLTFAKAVQGADKVLRNSNLEGQEIIDFFAKGHIIARNVLPEVKEQSFLDELQHAKIETEKVYHEFALSQLKCSHDPPVFWHLVKRVKEGGEGIEILGQCIKHSRSLKKFPGRGNDEAEEEDEEDYDEEEEDEEDYDEEDEDEEETIPFYQLIDLHQHSPRIHDIATSFRFAAMSSDLLQSDTIRLYQTGTSQKYNRAISWRSDLISIPVDTNDYLTFWCPTRNVTSEDSILSYGPGSHNDMARHTWYNNGRFKRIGRDGDDDDDDDDDEALTEEEDYNARKNYNTKCRAEKEWEDKFDIHTIKKYKYENNRGCAKRQHRRKSFDIAAKKFKDRRRKAGHEKNTNNAKRLNREQQKRMEEMSKRYGVDMHNEINVGDCVIHHGWIKHGATANGPSDAVTFSYIKGDDKRLGSIAARRGVSFFSKDGKAEDEMNFRQWYYDLEGEAEIDHPKLILVWPRVEGGTVGEDAIGGERELKPEQNMTEKNPCETCQDMD